MATTANCLSARAWKVRSGRLSPTAYSLVYGTGPGGKETLKQTLQFVDWGYLPDTHFLIRSDQEVSDNDMKECHLVLFGDEKSNKLIGRINAKAPVRFDGGNVLAGKGSYPRDEVSFKCVFPNPLAPGRLVMVNYAEEWDYSKLWFVQRRVQVPAGLLDLPPRRHPAVHYRPSGRRIFRR